MAGEEKALVSRGRGLAFGLVVLANTRAAYLEHMTAKAALQNVVGDGPMSFEARLKVLKELVMHHVEEEEQALFPELESLIDDAQMKALGTQMQETFEQMEALGHEGIMAQEMQAQTTEGGSTAEATSGGQEDGDGEAAGSKRRANGATRGASKASGRSQARA